MGQSWALDVTPILGGDRYLRAGGESRMILFVIWCLFSEVWLKRTLACPRAGVCNLAL